jgi:glycosyltransferase involved in cell wall biosynthesis
MKKILVVATLPVTLTSFLLPFVDRFRQLGWQVDAMAQGIEDNAECVQSFDHVWTVEWSRNPWELSNFFATPQMIKKLVATEGYDIVHVHTPVAAFVTRYALKNLKKHQQVRVIYTAHGFHFHPQGQPWKNAIFLNLERMAGQWTDHLVTINREDYLAADRHRLLPSTQIRYMPGIGIDLDKYNPQLVATADIAQVRQELGLAGSNPLFVAVAEFTPRKRHRDLLQALAKLARPEVHLALAGAGKLLPEMQQLAIDLGIKNQVHFLGKRQDIPILMRAAVATILVSAQEGLPRSVMESLALEVPVIGTKIRGIQELLEDGGGFLVEVGDVAGIARSMAEVLANPSQMPLLGQRGRLRMATYALPQIVKLTEELYTEAVSAG